MSFMGYWPSRVYGECPLDRPSRTHAQRIAHKAQITYVIANNHFEAKGAVNALQLKNMLTGRRLSAPEVLLRHYPKLRTIADPLPDDLAQGTLPLLA